MSTAGQVRYAAEWLELREPADARARSGELLAPLTAHLAQAPSATGRTVVHDLGCGTGSMGRWLAARLPGPQHWVLHDRDPELLRLAAAGMPDTAADGSPVTVRTRQGDITQLRAADLDGASLVTASALLDLLTADEVDAFAAACVRARCPALLALSVVGRVGLDPADPLDTELTAAFNAHQRRVHGNRRLLGPDAADAAARVFRRRGAKVWSRPSPWRLGAGQEALLSRWLTEWVAAAVEQQPELGPRADAYLRRRSRSCAAGRLRAVVHHGDLLALPAAPGGTPV
ncbi:class I SAM-dependent methyltransferase [Streptomyces celluloflavus]|uniref:class I SAM-dependent methyltransferase n=1 Tax=Streptomyces celluloflavus TaxID=58344 RepID=UPI003460FC5E|nr:class I SAM-dependent methyltransferase [Streptomyces celluloflavus]